MKPFFVFLVMLQFILPAKAGKADFISIELLRDSNLIDVDIKARGGYQGECVAFEVQNLSQDTLRLFLEPGRRLISSNNKYQDLLVVRELLVLLLPNAKERFNASAYCCISNNAAPYAGLAFALGYVEKSWQPLALMINRGNFGQSAIQSAVWSLSNKHDIAAVVDTDVQNTAKLRKLLAKLRGVNEPWYNLSYAKDTARLFSDRPENLWATMTYYVKNQCLVTINVKRSDNKQMVFLAMNGVAHGPGQYDFNLQLNVLGWPKTTYEVNVLEDGALIERKVFELK